MSISTIRMIVAVIPPVLRSRSYSAFCSFVISETAIFLLTICNQRLIFLMIFVFSPSELIFMRNWSAYFLTLQISDRFYVGCVKLTGHIPPRVRPAGLPRTLAIETGVCYSYNRRRVFIRFVN